MKTETIIHKDKKVIKKIKSDGSISYTRKGVYVGIDEKTGKKITTTVTAKTLASLDRKVNQIKLDFENAGSTKKDYIKIGNLASLAELWFDSYKNMVSSHNTLNRVRGYLDTYIIPQFGDYKPEMIGSVDVQIWVNKLAKNAKKVAENGSRRSPKGSAKDYGAIVHKLSDIFDFGITNFGLEKNPAKTVQIPPKPKSKNLRVMVLHEDELSIWIRYLNSLSNSRADRRFKLICETLLASALRISELLALHINDLDFETNEIIISKTIMWQTANKKQEARGK